MHERRYASRAAAAAFVSALSIVGSATPPADSDVIFGDGFATFTLAIDNYLSWCSVKENGDVSYSPTASFPDGAIVTLVASPSAGFYWGYFSGADSPGNSIGGSNYATTATMTSDRNVLVCCPVFPGGTCP